MPEQDYNNQEEIISEQDVHVMPSLTDEQTVSAPVEKKTNFLVIGIIIALLLAVGIGVGVYFLFFANKQPESIILPQDNKPDTEQPIKNQPVATTTPTSTPQVASSTFDLLTPDGRDQQRLNDVVTLRLALEQYYKNQSQFPYEMGALLDGYLTTLPREPLAEGKVQSYSYVVDSDRLDFKLIFTIESSPTFFSVRLTPGKYYASRQALMPYQESNGSGNGNNNGSGNGSTQQLPFSMNPPAQGLDSDGDGLTDIEENVWGTNPSSVDSDKDTHRDREELMSFYDPTSANKRLLEGKSAAVYKNSSYYYSVIYPSIFTVRALPPDNQQIIFSDPNGAFFTVAVDENPASLSTYAWYQVKNPTISTTNFRSFLVDNFPALQTPDGLITYLAVGSKVFVISYNLGTINEANYITTYRLFLKSFMIDESAGKLKTSPSSASSTSEVIE